MNNEKGMSSVSTVDLDILKYALYEAVSAELVRNISIEVAAPDFFRDQIGVRMVQRLAAKRADETQITASESVPINWWAHLWLSVLGPLDPDDQENRLKATLRRWFIQTRAITTSTTFYRSCPHLDLPERGGLHVRWLLDVNDDRLTANW